MNWLKRTICKWLGIDDLHRQLIETSLRTSKQIGELTSVAADVSIYGESQIIVVSRVGGGRVKIINAKFNGLREVTDLIRYLEERFGSRSSVIDFPRNDERMRL